MLAFACPARAETTCTGTPLLRQKRDVRVTQAMERYGLNACRLVGECVGQSVRVEHLPERSSEYTLRPSSETELQTSVIVTGAPCGDSRAAPRPSLTLIKDTLSAKVLLVTQG
jgi:hypothetical protein